VLVVGLGPAGPAFTTEAARRALAEAPRAYLRTGRHPAAAPFSQVPTFDHLYQAADNFEELYRAIVDTLAQAAAESGRLVYAVPGSPLVAERTVELLRADPRVKATTQPAVSFCELAWDRLGVDPLACSVRLVDGARFAEQAAGERGPLLVGQCWSNAVLSEVKLSWDDTTGRGGPVVTVLHHLGLADERVHTVAWAELDWAVAPDHLTSLWIPSLDPPVATEMVALDGLVRTLRERCPWDRAQTHRSLRRHLLEECYELADAIDELSAESEPAAVDHLEEELGDVLFQVYFHSRLAAEEGWFTLADVARTVRQKLVGRHPHVFGDVVAESPDAVVANWEVLKRVEKGRASVTDGVPVALPALALANKLQQRASSIGLEVEGGELMRRANQELIWLSRAAPDEDSAEVGTHVGALLWAVADLARRWGGEPEADLRRAALDYAARIRVYEAGGARWAAAADSAGGG
jgi:tetrapyrrole methylase family protein / MazG family protein